MPYMVVRPISCLASEPVEGYEVTQATTKKFHRKLTQLEKPGAPKQSYGKAGGWIGYQPESYWCRRILDSVKQKLVKLAKGHYQNAKAQHLLIYDNMDTAAVDLGEALKRLRPRLSRILKSKRVKFNTISVVSTQSVLLSDIGAACEKLSIPAPTLCGPKRGP
jgi:hypothetical protein